MTQTGTGISYKQAEIGETWDAIVIGSGMGGLTAAALLALHGRKRVLVLERHYAAGGFTHVFHRPGYEWDVGVHYIGEVHRPGSPLRAMFDHLSEGRLEWHAMPDVYDRAIIAGQPYDFVSGVDRFRERMVSYFPNEATAIDRYIQAITECAASSDRYFGSKAIPRPIARIAGRLMQAPFLRWASRTTLDVVSGLTNNQDLIGVLTSQWGDYGLPPARSSFAAHAIIATHYLNGAAYPVGGSSRIAASIAPVIESAGGRIVISAEAERIVLDSSNRATGVRMKDGREFRAPLVISDAGAANTFGKLLSPDAPGASEAMGEIRDAPSSMAYLSLYVGVRQSAADLGLKGTNLWVYPGPDHDRNQSRFQANPTAPLPVAFISFPSAKDPDFERRHPGRATLEVICPVSYDWFRQWEQTPWKRRGPDYDAFKDSLAARLREQLEQQVPEVRGKIDYAELSTPLSTRHFMNYSQGEAYGVAASPQRFRLKCLAPRTGVANLYLTGQDVALLGVTGAMMGGVVTASAILRRNLVTAMTRGAKRGQAAA
jgi:all-trans-retinol 13,14-reductase